MKTCRQCGVAKPLDEFMKDSRRKDGRGSYCKPCGAINSRASRAKNPGASRRYYLKNRERLKEAGREYRHRPEVREARRKAQADYNDRNREKVRGWKAAWREQNRDYYSRWEVANRDKVRANKRKSEAKRRAKKRSLPVEDVCPKEIFVRDKGLCGICGTSVDPSDWHLDHIVPLALNGPHTSDNVQVTHPSCNLSKGSRLAA